MSTHKLLMIHIYMYKYIDRDGMEIYLLEALSVTET